MSDGALNLLIRFTAMDKLTGGLKNMLGASQRMSTGIRAARDELRKMEQQQKAIAGFRQLKKGLADTRTAMQEAQTRASTLGAELARTENPSRKMRREFEQARKEAEKLATRFTEQSRALDQSRNSLASAGIDTRNLARHQRDLTGDIDAANRRLQQQQERLERLGRASERAEKMKELGGKLAGAGAIAGAAGAAAAAPIVMQARAAMTFESAMADVRKVVNFETPRQFQQMSRDVLDLSTRVPMAAEGIASIVAAAGRANIARAELLGFAEDAAKLGIAFDISAEEAGQTMAKWRTAFSLTQPQVVALSDQINALTNRYGGNAAAVSGIVTRIGSLGKVAGVTAPQIAAMAQLLNSVGVEEEVAATGIKNMMLAMTKGTAATKSQKAALETLGLESSTLAKRMQTDASGAITDVLSRISQIPKEAQAGLLTELFGSESVGAIAPLLTNLDKLQSNLGLVGDKAQYAGSMNKEFLARIATTEGATGLLGNGFKALNIELGQMLLPTITAFAESAKGVIQRVREWAQANPGVAKALVIITAVLAGLAVVIGGILVVAGGLISAFGVVTAAATAAGITLSALIAPVLAVVAVAAAAGYLIYQNWDMLKAKFQPLIDAIIAVWDKLMAAFGTLASDPALMIWGQMIADIFGGVVMATINTVVGVLTGAFTIIGGLIDFITAILTGNFTAAWAAVKTIFSGGVQAIVSIMMGVGEAMASIGTAIIGGIKRGIMAGWESVKSTVSSLATSLPGWLKKPLGIKSPSRVFMMLGGHVASGLRVGIDKGRDGAVRSVRRMAGAVAGAGATAVAAPALAFAQPQIAAPELPAPITQALRPARNLASALPAPAAQLLRPVINAGTGAALPSLGPLAGMLQRLARPPVAAGTGMAPPSPGAGLPGASPRPLLNLGNQPAFRPAPAAPAPDRGAAAARSEPRKIEIHIHQLPGESADDLARKVEQILRRNAGGGGSYGDDF
jgi:TP901 family phage tail tape measure protein